MNEEMNTLEVEQKEPEQVEEFEMTDFSKIVTTLWARKNEFLDNPTVVITEKFTKQKKDGRLKNVWYYQLEDGTKKRLEISNKNFNDLIEIIGTVPDVWHENKVTVVGSNKVWKFPDGDRAGIELSFS